MSDHHFEDQTGEVRAWLEQESSIHLKAVTRDGDPVELSGTEARCIAAALNRLADELDRLDE